MRKNKKKNTLEIFADGGSRGNPGPAGVGVVFFSGKDKISEISKYIGPATNNVAEYLAVIYGLQEAVYLGARGIVLNLDSQLVAKQLRGEYRVKDLNIRKFFDLAVNLLQKFDTVEIVEIPREKNKEADELVNSAINLNAII